MALVRMRQTNLETFDGGAADSLLMSGAMSEDQPAQTVGDLQGACEEFLQTGDSDVLLVAVSEQVGSGRTEEVAATLLREEHRPILAGVGWDLIILLAPHLHSRSTHCWSVLQCITELCPPKEMSLALLEQMELAVDSTTLFLMLELLQKVVLGLQREAAVVSCLRSACRLLQRSYHELEDSSKKSGDMRERWTAENGSDSETAEENNNMEVECPHSKSGDCDDQHENSDYGNNKTVHGESAVEGEVALQPPAEGQATTAAPKSQPSEGGVTLLASQALQFIGPFVEEIHQLHCSATPHICSHWSPRQRQCISLLLSLLDYPLVQYDLSSSGWGSLENRRTAEAIMDMIVRCHCGCVELLGWTGGGVGELGGEQEATEETEASLPPVGLACFTYLLLSEQLCASYLPAVVRGDYLLHVSINHATALLRRPERLVILKGLLLLETLIGRVCPFSLPSHLLDDKQYQSLAELLTNLMVTCPHKTVRRRSVPLLLGLVKCFSDAGRYRIYRGLLHSTHHAGVQELLIHSIKNEIDQALKVGHESLFVGPNLVPFLDWAMSISSDMDLMKESSRVMAALNFLRYLLIRDKPEDNRTGIWTTVRTVREKFTTPLRQLLMATKAHCRHELKVKQDEGAGVRSEGGTEVTVEVMGERLPDVMPEDEIRALQVAEQHLAMMESVLVRVEELMEGTQLKPTTETNP